MEILDQPGWLWGLSLIVFTMAIHATAVVMLAFVAVRIRVRRETRGLPWVMKNGPDSTRWLQQVFRVFSWVVQSVFEPDATIDASWYSERVCREQAERQTDG